MNVSNQPAMSLLDSVLRAESVRTEVGVAVLKKSQDVEAQQGEAMVNLIEQAGAVVPGQGFDAYA